MGELEIGTKCKLPRYRGSGGAVPLAGRPSSRQSGPKTGEGSMPYEFTQEGLALQERVRGFMDEQIYPNETEYQRQYREGGDHSYPPILDALKAEARRSGLWNLFLPHLREGDPGIKLSNVDYA